MSHIKLIVRTAIGVTRTRKKKLVKGLLRYDAHQTKPHQQFPYRGGKS